MKFDLSVVIIIGVLVQQIRCKGGTTATSFVPLTPFHPITQEQYDAILGLTSGEPVISEARLIASGIAALKGLAAGITAGFSASWLPAILQNLLTNSQQNQTNEVLQLQDSYPLCVVKNPEHETAPDKDEKTVEDAETTDDNNNNNNVGPVIKCIMVITNEEEEMAEPKPTAPSTHTHYSQPQSPPPPPPPPPYPYSYPWYGNYYAYAPPFGMPNAYQQPQQYQQDYVPHYRYYPNHYEAYSPKQREQHKTDNIHKTKYQKPSYTGNRKPHPAPVNYYDYTAPPTTLRRRKTKRDQYSTTNEQQQAASSHHRNYAKLTNFPAGGYQPSFYPQISYQSQYPKVAYSPSYNYPSPVYVGTTPRSQQQLDVSEESS